MLCPENNSIWSEFENKKRLDINYQFNFRDVYKICFISCTYTIKFLLKKLISKASKHIKYMYTKLVFRNNSYCLQRSELHLCMDKLYLLYIRIHLDTKYCLACNDKNMQITLNFFVPPEESLSNSYIYYN